MLQGIGWWWPCYSTYMNGKIIKGKRIPTKVRPKSLICVGALCEWKCHTQIRIIIKLEKGTKQVWDPTNFLEIWHLDLQSKQMIGDHKKSTTY